MEVPEVRYANSGDLRIAYQRFGAGPDVVVIPPFLSNVELFWDHELYRRVLEHSARHLRTLHFDKRGMGCSDRCENEPTLDERIDDIRAVMDAEGVERANIMGLSEGGLMAQHFAARHPERVDRLVLVNATCGVGTWSEVARYVADSDPAFDAQAVAAFFAELPSRWGNDPQFSVDWIVPSQSHNESFVRWFGRLERQSATPADVARHMASIFGLADDPPLGTIRAATTVISVRGDRIVPPSMGRYLADQIPDATYLEFEGTDHMCWVMPNWRDIWDAWTAAITGETATYTNTRRFAAVLFTDVVSSTASAAKTGDARWRDVLDSHDRISDHLVTLNGGRLVKHTGDGILAVFDTPSSAVNTAVALVGDLAAIDITIRAGVHAGELEIREDGDVSGTAVNLAARVEQIAQPGQVLVSSTVRDLLLGGEHSFTDAGDHTLKGVDGTWRLYAHTR